MLGFLKKAYTETKQAMAEVAEAAQYKSKYAERVSATMENIVEGRDNNSQSIISIKDNDVAPFRMKKGERYLFTLNATLGTYKNDGRISGHGITARVKIMQGVYYRVGSGRIAMGKSWVFDNPGLLHVTTDRIVFDGTTKNVKSSIDKIIKLGIDPNEMILTVDREAGGDWWFRVDEWPSEEEMATFVLYQRGLIK